MDEIPCSVCKEGGHGITQCPWLTQPLVPGFYAPPPGGGQGTEEDE